MSKHAQHDEPNDDLAPDTTDAELQAALANNMLPIREVSRITGVNPVTLRAWERRYGLIVPKRTAKGHRLYTEEHIQRIQAILTWLNRGVAVSQVKALLKTAALPNAHVDSDGWSNARVELLNAISTQAERRLDAAFKHVEQLYPPKLLCEQLLLPLLAELEQRWQGQFGAQLEKVFFYSWLRSKLGARIYHNNRQLSGAPLLLINLSDLPMEPALWLSAWLLSSADCAVEVFDWPLPPLELALAIEHIKPRAALLYSGQALAGAQLPKLLADSSCPRLLVGPTVRIHHTDLQALQTQLNDLHLADDPLLALDTLQRLDLLGPRKDAR